MTMALTQKINPLTLAREMYELRFDINSRMSIIDLFVLLAINEAPSQGKADLNEKLSGDRQPGKSTLDRPINRLISAGFIKSFENPGSASKNGECRRLYALTSRGDKFLQDCYRR